MPTGTPRPSLTIAEVAALTKTTREHIQRQVSLGAIPSYKVGAARRIAAEAVDALMGTAPVTPTEDDDAALDEYVRKLVDAAPKLTERQRNKLATIFGGAK